MSPSKALWDKLLTLGGGIEKQHQTCEYEASFDLFQTMLNLLLRGKGVFQVLHMPVINFFLFKFYLTVEMFCLNPDFSLLFTDSGAPFTCDGWMYPAESRAY